jgi:hypothetical protein
VVFPAVAETLDPLHKLGRGILWKGQQRVVTKVSVYLVIDSVRRLNIRVHALTWFHFTDRFLLEVTGSFTSGLLLSVPASEPWTHALISNFLLRADRQTSLSVW